MATAVLNCSASVVLTLYNRDKIIATIQIEFRHFYVLIDVRIT